MITIILPGFSLHNKEWGEDIKKQMELGHRVLVHEWLHWTKGSFSLPREVKSILNSIGTDEVNLIAKSVGTRVAMNIITKIPKQIVKVILCGIPTKGESDSAKKTYSASLLTLSPTCVIVYQNTKDPFANYSDIKKFIGKINPQIKVVEKPRSDHHYPYSDDFLKFLSE